jgi:phospholipase/carboxylesterase
MRRSFRRVAEGVFDEDDVWRQGKRARGFRWRGAHTHPHRRPDRARLPDQRQYRRCDDAARPRLLWGGILLPAMVPLTAVPVDLAGAPVLILSGAQDPLCLPRTRGSRTCCASPASIIAC